ncbi:MAG: hypothetical protein WCS75_11780 [Sphingomonas sp.]|uniref:hypothetical protein n=1 Tax=Sphingomonas sp. TaxID=28214 RepID=UPI003569E9BC
MKIKKEVDAMLKLKVTLFTVLAVSVLGVSQIASAQTNAAKLAAARACDGNQWSLKGYDSYKDCIADYIAYYPDLPPGQGTEL